MGEHIVFVIPIYSKMHTMDTLWCTICDLQIGRAHKLYKWCFVCRAQCPEVVFIILQTERIKKSHNNDSSSAPPRICWDSWCWPRAWKQPGQEVLWHISPRQVARNGILCLKYGGLGSIKWKAVGTQFSFSSQKKKILKELTTKDIFKTGLLF